MVIEERIHTWLRIIRDNEDPHTRDAVEYAIDCSKEIDKLWPEKRMNYSDFKEYR